MKFDPKSLMTGIPVIGGMFDDTSDKAMAELTENKGIWDGVKPGDLAWENYNPEDYSYMGDVEAAMAEGTTVSEDPRLKTAQMNVLSRLSGLADTGLSEVDQLGYENARSLAGREARASREAAMQNAQARGVSGSGLEFAMREMGSQDAATRAQQAALQQASDSARQRALYTQAFGDMAGQVRGQDYQVNRGNADILNQFNLANTGATNQARFRNADTRQDVANQTTGSRNQAGMFNTTGVNDTKQNNVTNSLNWAKGRTGAGAQMADGYGAQNATNTSQRNENTKLLIEGAKAMGGAV